MHINTVLFHIDIPLKKCPPKAFLPLAKYYPGGLVWADFHACSALQETLMANWAGADEGNRTPTLSLAADFESATSTSSITSAYKNGPLSKTRMVHEYVLQPPLLRVYKHHVSPLYRS